MNIGLNIKKVRELKNISQEKLSEISGIPRTSLGRYERNERTPNMSIVSKIAKSLEVEEDIILNGIDTSIYYKDDIINLYKKLNTKTPLRDFFSDTGTSIEYECFIYGITSNKNFYYKLSEFLNLTNEQFYNCILSLNIYQLELERGFYYNCFPKSDIELIIKNNILEKQDFEDLLFNGLSKKNKKSLKLYVVKRESERKKLESQNKFSIDNLSLSKNSLDNFDLLISLFNCNGLSIKSSDDEVFYITNSSSNESIAKLTKDDLINLNKIFMFWGDSFILNTITTFSIKN